ncbi:MAG: hypothetical protein QOH15_1043, partial [Gaiellales bacterium]|nr:hypothetical protein [Gaiellales bacterium]
SQINTPIEPSPDALAVVIFPPGPHL